MTNYTLLAGAFFIGFLANIALRKAKSRTTRLLIGIPSMIMMLAVVMLWIK